MKPDHDTLGKMTEIDVPVESGYAGWKRAKVARGLAQARDRAAMIPLARVLRDLKVER